MAKDDDWDADDLEDEEDYDDEEDDEDDDADKEDSARSKRLVVASLKILVSLALLGGAAIIVFAPGKIPANLTAKVKQATPFIEQAKRQVSSAASKITASDKKAPTPPRIAPAREPEAARPAAPVDFAQKREMPITAEPVEKNAEQPVEQPAKPQQNRFNISGRGQIPDLLTAISNDPQLKDILLKADVYTFEKLPKLRPFIKSLILRWAKTNSYPMVEALTGVPFKTFEDHVLVELLPFTTLKQAGLTPSYDERLIKESPSNAAGTLFTYLKPVVDALDSDKDKIDTVEPIATFFVYKCGGKKDCLMSLDLLIEMLGLTEYKDKLPQ